MSASTLERPSAVPPAPPAEPNRRQRWARAWRAAIRIGAREAWRTRAAKWRLLLVAVMIGLPVAAGTFAVVVQHSGSAPASERAQALKTLP